MDVFLIGDNARTQENGIFAQLPAGLDLSAEDIALAITPEIQRVFAGGSGESLRERKMSIHKGKQSTPLVASR